VRRDGNGSSILGNSFSDKRNEPLGFIRRSVAWGTVPLLGVPARHGDGNTLILVVGTAGPGTSELSLHQLLQGVGLLWHVHGERHFPPGLASGVLECGPGLGFSLVFG